MLLLVLFDLTFLRVFSKKRHPGKLHFTFFTNMKDLWLRLYLFLLRPSSILLHFLLSFTFLHLYFLSLNSISLHTPSLAVFYLVSVAFIYLLYSPYLPPLAFIFLHPLSYTPMSLYSNLIIVFCFVLGCRRRTWFQRWSRDPGRCGGYFKDGN